MCSRRSPIIILFSSLIIFGNKIDLHFAKANQDLLAESLSLFVQQTFIGETNLKQVYLYTNFDKNLTENRFGLNDLTSKVLRNLSSSTYTILYHKQKRYINFKHHDVVLLDSVNTFSHFYGNLKNTGTKDLARTLLFISSLTILDYETMYFIFKDLYLMEIIRVALVIILANNDIIMLTYFPFTRTSCRDFQPVIINRYLADQHRWEYNKYFPQKLSNFYGCPIYCCAWNNVPYFSAVMDENSGHVTKYVGFEAELLQFAALSLNFTIKIHWIEPIKEEDKSQENIIRKNFLQYCDLALGAFNYKKDLHTSTFSQTNFHSFSHIYIVTNVINFYTQYEKLAFPFNYTVWFALGLTYALSSMLICTCGWQQKLVGYRNFLISSANKTPHLNFYALGVGIPMASSHLPTRNFARFVLVCWIFLMFVLRTAYQSGMYQMLRDNKVGNTPQSIESVFEQNYLISMTPGDRKYLNILPATQRVRILNTTILQALTEMVNAKEPMAIITPYEYFDYFGKKNGSHFNNLHLINYRLLTEQLTFYVRHRSYLVRVLNKIISYAQYYGFAAKWARQDSLSLKQTPEFRKRSNENFESNPLSMSEMGAIFMILIWLQVLAFFVFLIELFWYNFNKILLII